MSAPASCEVEDFEALDSRELNNSGVAQGAADKVCGSGQVVVVVRARGGRGVSEGGDWAQQCKRMRERQGCSGRRQQHEKGKGWEADLHPARLIRRRSWRPVRLPSPESVTRLHPARRRLVSDLQRPRGGLGFGFRVVS